MRLAGMLAAAACAAALLVGVALGSSRSTPKPACVGWKPSGGDTTCIIDWANGDGLAIRVHSTAPHRYEVCVAGSEARVGGARRKCLDYQIP